MKPETESYISALLDEELSSVEQQQCLDHLSQDVNQRETWSRYHLARQAMHNELPEKLDLDLSFRVMQALENEAPLKTNAQPSERMSDISHPATAFLQFSGWFRPLGSLALAASVAVVSVWVWNHNVDNSAAESSPLVQNQSSPIVPTSITRVNAVPVSAPLGNGTHWRIEQAGQNSAVQYKLNDFLIHHAEHSAPLQGLIPQARVVGFDATTEAAE